MGITLSELFNQLPHQGLAPHLIQEASPPFISKIQPNICISPLYKPPSPLFSTTLPSNALTNPNLSTKLKLTARDFIHRMDEPSVLKARKNCSLMRDPWPVSTKNDEHVPKKKVGNEKNSFSSSPFPSFLTSSPTLLVRNGDTPISCSTFVKVACTMPSMIDLLPHDDTFVYPSFNDSFSTTEDPENLNKKQLKTDTQVSTNQSSPSFANEKSMSMTANASSKLVKSQALRSEKSSKLNQNTANDLGSATEKKFTIQTTSTITTSCSTKVLRVSSAKLSSKSQATFPVSYPVLSPPPFPNHSVPRQPVALSSKLLHSFPQHASAPILSHFSKPLYLPLKSFSCASPSLHAKTLSSSPSLYSSTQKTKQTTLKLITRLYFPSNPRRTNTYISNLQNVSPSSTKLPTLKKITIT